MDRTDNAVHCLVIYILKQ